MGGRGGGKSEKAMRKNLNLYGQKWESSTAQKKIDGLGLCVIADLVTTRLN
jgi:hypothetical protein